jgi:hypothetical protein
MKLADYRGIATQVNEELEAVFKKYGFRMGKLSASVAERDGTIRYSITVTDMNLKDESGEQTTAEALRFKNQAVIFGLKPEWLGQTVNMGGKDFTVAGLKGGRAEKCVLMTHGGKTYVVRPIQLVQAMTLKELRPAL